MKRRNLPLILAALLPAAVARADEGGVPFWMSGTYASLAAVPSPPGLFLPVVAFFFNGSAPAGRTFTRGQTVAVDLKSRGPLFLFQPTYAPDFKLAGGQLTVGVAWGFGQNRTQAEVTIPSTGAELQRSDSVWGLSDFYPLATIAWASGSNNGMGYITGDIPVGSYDSKRLANIGIGHAAIDFGGAYTYFNEKSGHEASATTGFTFNFENPDTHYQNGVDWHLEWAASQFLSKNWNVGVAGYLSYQLTGDSGSGAKLGDFKSGVASVGGQGSYFFTLRGLQGFVNLRGYWELWSQHRIRSAALLATVEIPLWPRK